MSSPPIGYFAKFFLFLATVFLSCVACTGQTHRSANGTNFNGSETHFSTSQTRLMVCNKGNGSFSGKLPREASNAGVTVSVGAAKKQGFAARACTAKLIWKHHEMVVAPEAVQADIDVMGADLGFGVPVVAFQIKASADDPHIQYKIYSLTKPPQLLRTITGEDYFSAADTQLNESVEIWTTDAAAVNGLEGMPRSVFDVPPAMVLRFKQKKLIDVSSEFQPYFNHQIEILRSQLDAQQLSDFKNSDGKLSEDRPPQQGQLHGLLATKVKVLEIVWCYLYSGREQEAWDALARMWPSADLDRIRTSIVSARTRGLSSQVDGVSQNPPLLAQFKSSIIYEHDLGEGFDVPMDKRETVTDSAPSQVLVQISPPRNPKDWGEVREMELVIDEAGKVRSARMQEEPDRNWSARMKEEWLTRLKEEPNKDWIDAAAGWKYIPAFKDGHPKAFRLKWHVQRDR